MTRGAQMAYVSAVIACLITVSLRHANYTRYKTHQNDHVAFSAQMAYVCAVIACLITVIPPVSTVSLRRSPGTR
jgi:hypothetical protein